MAPISEWTFPKQALTRAAARGCGSQEFHCTRTLLPQARDIKVAATLDMMRARWYCRSPIVPVVVVVARLSDYSLVSGHRWLVAVKGERDGSRRWSKECFNLPQQRIMGKQSKMSDGKRGRKTKGRKRRNNVYTAGVDATESACLVSAQQKMQTTCTSRKRYLQRNDRGALGVAPALSLVSL